MINFFFENWMGTNPIPNGLDHFNYFENDHISLNKEFYYHYKRIIFKYIDRYNIKYRFSNLNSDKINKDDTNIFLLELGFKTTETLIYNNVIYKLKPNTIKFLNDHQIPIVICVFYDNLNYFDPAGKYGYSIEILIKSIIEKGIKTKVIFFQDNPFFESNIKEYLKNHPLSQNFYPIGVSYARYHVPTIYKQYSDNIITSEQQISNLNRNKMAIMLTSAHRNFRLFLLTKLSAIGLLDKIYYSYLDIRKGIHNNTIQTLQETIGSLNQHEIDCLSNLINKVPIELDFKQNKLMDFLDSETRNYIINPKNLILDSWFSIITETQVNFHPIRQMFITEKILKSFVTSHPCILLGCSRTLEYLRSLGFQTYNDLFDESYDQIDDNLSRINYISDQISKLRYKDSDFWKKYYLNNKEKFDYNQKLLFKEDLGDLFNYMFSTIKQIQNL